MSKVTKNTATVVSNSTELALGNQFTLSQIPDLLSQINQKIKSLEGSDDESNIISGPIDMFGELKNINDPAQLMACYAYVTKKIEGITSFSQVFKDAAPTIKVPVIKIAGVTLPVLQKAILSQYKKVTLAEVLNGLKETKKTLEECLSEEDKKQAKLQNAGAALANLLQA
jgi:hypothetical protein